MKMQELERNLMNEKEKFEKDSKEKFDNLTKELQILRASNSSNNNAENESIKLLNVKNNKLVLEISLLKDIIRQECEERLQIVGEMEKLKKKQTKDDFATPNSDQNHHNNNYTTTRSRNSSHNNHNNNLKDSRSSPTNKQQQSLASTALIEEFQTPTISAVIPLNNSVNSANGLSSLTINDKEAQFIAQQKLAAKKKELKIIKLKAAHY